MHYCAVLYRTTHPLGVGFERCTTCVAAVSRSQAAAACSNILLEREKRHRIRRGGPFHSLLYTLVNCCRWCRRYVSIKLRTVKLHRPRSPTRHTARAREQKWKGITVTADPHLTPLFPYRSSPPCARPSCWGVIHPCFAPRVPRKHRSPSFPSPDRTARASRTSSTTWPTRSWLEGSTRPKNRDLFASSGRSHRRQASTAAAAAERNVFSSCCRLARTLCPRSQGPRCFCWTRRD